MIHLSTPPEQYEALKQLPAYNKEIIALLIVSETGQDGLRHKPVTAIFGKSRTLQFVNLDFEPMPQAGILGRARVGLHQTLVGQGALPVAEGIPGFAERLLQELTDQCRVSQPDRLQRLARAAEARQLTLLATTLDRLSKHPTGEALLAAAYVASEILLAEQAA